MDDVREPAVERLDDVLARIDAEHLGALVHELEGEGLPEAAQADDRDGPVGGRTGGEAGAEESVLSQ